VTLTTCSLAVSAATRHMGSLTAYVVPIWAAKEECARFYSAAKGVPNPSG
jgi:hypothetical protein